MRTTVSSLVAVVGFATVAVAPGQSLAADLTTLVSFCAPSCSEGSRPSGSLILDAKGNLLGPTLYGGSGFLGGTVFEVAKTPDGYANTPTTVVSFCVRSDCADGVYPNGALLADTKGNLFGVTHLPNGGTVYEIVKTPAGYASTPTTLVNFCELGPPPGATYEFCADGAFPYDGLIADPNGNLFGTTNAGGANGEGTVFEIVMTPDGYARTPITLVSFCAQPNCTDGSEPIAGLIADAKGNLFGTTTGHINVPPGRNTGGTVFEIVKTADGYASAPTTLVNFCSLPNCMDGAEPQARVIADANGNLFGTTVFRGTNGTGTVFEIVKTADGYASAPITLVSFSALPNGVHSAGPSGLIIDAKGNLFGTTETGGANGTGTVFEIVKTATGYGSTPIVLVSFCSLPNCADGDEPVDRLIADAYGNLFGVTSGGIFHYGTVFEVTDSGFQVPIALPRSEVATTGSGLAYSRVSHTFSGTVTITNISDSPISGPLSILLTNLTAGVTLTNAQGTFSGSPFLPIPGVTNLAAGQSASVSVEFENHSFGMINFTPMVYSGNL